MRLGETHRFSSESIDINRVVQAPAGTFRAVWPENWHDSKWIMDMSDKRVVRGDTRSVGHNNSYKYSRVHWLPVFILEDQEIMESLAKHIMIRPTVLVEINGRNPIPATGLHHPALEAHLGIGADLVPLSYTRHRQLYTMKAIRNTLTQTITIKSAVNTNEQFNSHAA